jgi:hypothetical protein
VNAQAEQATESEKSVHERSPRVFWSKAAKALSTTPSKGATFAGWFCKVRMMPQGTKPGELALERHGDPIQAG